VLLVCRRGVFGDRPRLQIRDILEQVRTLRRGRGFGFLAQALGQQPPDAGADQTIGEKIFFEQEVDHGEGKL
jgi:hypothetical protein